MTAVIKYSHEMARRWDAFVKASKNGTFLFYRGYMDYHADRFKDNSLIITDDNGEWETILPATVDSDGWLVSHGGLTYGGFVMTPSTRAQDPLVWFDALRRYAGHNGIKGIKYRPTPYIYHTMPADEDLYALFRNGAQIDYFNLATVVTLPDTVSSRLGKRAAKRARKFGITVEETISVADLWQIIVDDRRRRHNTVPVHSYAEMELLHGRFPENIRLFVACKDGAVVAGAVVYVMPESGVLHLQYAAATEEARDSYAVDAIYHSLVFEVFPGYRYFDFGTSNEDHGRLLNTNMTAHKEEFGGRSVVYQSYSLEF